MISHIANKKVLFITTKNIDYIRNVQELNLIKEKATDCRVIGSYSKNYFVRLMTVFFKVFFLRMSQFDTVFIGFAPQFILPLFYWKFKNTFVVIDFFISFFDTLCCDRKKIKSNSPIGKALHRLDKKTLCLADIIISDTKVHGQYFSSEFQVPSEKLFTMYLQADTSIYHPLKRKRPEYLKDKYVVLYFGSMLPLQGVEVVLKAMGLLKEKKELFFFFIGPVTDRHLRNVKPISDNIEYINWLSQEKLAEYIDIADLCLAGHFNASVQKATRTIPGKAYIYEAMNKKIVLGDNSANHERFWESDKVVFAQMGNSKALADVILKQLAER